MRRTWLAVALVLLLSGSGASAQSSSGWLVYGNDLARSSSTDTSLSPPSVRPAWFTPISGRVSAQALVAQDVPGPGQRTVYVATSKGVLYALAENGYVRWRVELGQLERVCQQIDGYGVTGTPAIDLGTHAIYAADAFGRIHALDLATGAERPGWPVTVYTDFRRELVWGALTAVDGSLYFGTGSYCDRKMIAKVFRVDIATGGVSQWEVVPKRLGGGGGVWGWGGLAYSAARDSLYAVTGNAFEGGTNRGKRFREYAGYGERIVELGPDLRVRGSSHPSDIHQVNDLDFVGSPVVFEHGSCGELAAALNKNGSLYLWRTRRLAAGPISSLRLSNPTLAAPAALAGRLLAAHAGAVRRDSGPARPRERQRQVPCAGRLEPEGRERALQRLADDRRGHRLARRERQRGLVARRVPGDDRSAPVPGAPGRARLRRADGGRRPHLRPAVHGSRPGLCARVRSRPADRWGRKRPGRVPKLRGRDARLGEP